VAERLTERAGDLAELGGQSLVDRRQRSTLHTLVPATDEIHQRVHVAEVHLALSLVGTDLGLQPLEVRERRALRGLVLALLRLALRPATLCSVREIGRATTTRRLARGRCRRRRKPRRRGDAVARSRRRLRAPRQSPVLVWQLQSHLVLLQTVAPTDFGDVQWGDRLSCGLVRLWHGQPTGRIALSAELGGLELASQEVPHLLRGDLRAECGVRLRDALGDVIR